MRILYFFLFLSSLAFTQNKLNESDIIGRWEIKIKVKELIKQETKGLDMLEKMAIQLASGFAEDIVDSVDKYIVFEKNNKAILTIDYNDFSEKEEIIWSINQNDEIIIDDSLNKKINIGSENNTWIYLDDMIFIKEQTRINKNIFLKKTY